jgi:hypothetical protein
MEGQEQVAQDHADQQREATPQNHNDQMLNEA